MNAPPKTLSFHRAYMRRLISSVKAFASSVESFLPISRLSGWRSLGMRYLRFIAGLFQAFFQVRAIFFGERRSFPAREAFHSQAAQFHQLAEHAAAMGAQVFADYLHEPGEQIMFFLR